MRRVIFFSVLCISLLTYVRIAAALVDACSLWEDLGPFTCKSQCWYYSVHARGIPDFAAGLIPGPDESVVHEVTYLTLTRDVDVVVNHIISTPLRISSCVNPGSYPNGESDYVPPYDFVRYAPPADRVECPPLPEDCDGDRFFVGKDCNDENPDIHPGATEICNAKDDNCNGTIDEGCQAKFEILDSKGSLVSTLEVAPSGVQGRPSCGFDPGNPKLEFTLRCTIVGESESPNSCTFRAAIEAVPNSGGHIDAQHGGISRPTGTLDVLSGVLGSTGRRKFTYNASEVGGNVKVKFTGTMLSSTGTPVDITPLTLDIHVAVKEQSGSKALTAVVPMSGDRFEIGPPSVGHGTNHHYATVAVAQKLTELPSRFREAIRKQNIFENFPNEKYPGITIDDRSASVTIVTFMGSSGSVSAAGNVVIRNDTTGQTVTVRPDSDGRFTALINAKPADLLLFSALKSNPTISLNPAIKFGVWANGMIPNLVYTSISLPQGGVFDVDAKPEDGKIDNPWNPPHATHRCGTNADIRVKNIPREVRGTLDRIIQNSSFVTPYSWESLSDPGASHWNLQYKKASK
jgi:hypothetical protein